MNWQKTVDILEPIIINCLELNSFTESNLNVLLSYKLTKECLEKEY